MGRAVQRLAYVDTKCVLSLQTRIHKTDSSSEQRRRTKK